MVPFMLLRFILWRCPLQYVRKTVLWVWEEQSVCGEGQRREGQSSVTPWGTGAAEAASWGAGGCSSCGACPEGHCTPRLKCLQTAEPTQSLGVVRTTRDMTLLSSSQTSSWPGAVWVRQWWMRMLIRSSRQKSGDELENVETLGMNCLWDSISMSRWQDRKVSTVQGKYTWDLIVVCTEHLADGQY